jgi:hypothetical protein
MTAIIGWRKRRVSKGVMDVELGSSGLRNKEHTSIIGPKGFTVNSYTLNGTFSAANGDF